MRTGIAILLLSGILLQTTAKLTILIQFRANQDYIAKNLCVNRKKPKSCCKGSCQLNKKLQEADKKENQGLPGNLKDKFNLSACTLPENHPYHFYKKDELNSFVYLNHYRYSAITAVFRPPCFIA